MQLKILISATNFTTSYVLTDGRAKDDEASKDDEKSEKTHHLEALIRTEIVVAS